MAAKGAPLRALRHGERDRVRHKDDAANVAVPTLHLEPSPAESAGATAERCRPRWTRGWWREGAARAQAAGITAAQGSGRANEADGCPEQRRQHCADQPRKEWPRTTDPFRLLQPRTSPHSPTFLVLHTRSNISHPSPSTGEGASHALSCLYIPPVCSCAGRAFAVRPAQSDLTQTDRYPLTTSTVCQ